LPAAALLPFANGAIPISIAAWLGPVFLLRFVRTQRAWVGLPVAYTLLAALSVFHFLGLMPEPGALVYFFTALFALVAFLPYVADRLLTPRLHGWIGTLVFPATWVTMEYLVSLSPGATWGLAPYSQYGNLALLQVLSVTGMWGITFLIGWCAPVVNLVWEEGFGSKSARAAALAFVGTVGAVLLAGEARMALFPPSGETVRVASLSGELLGTKLSKSPWQHLLRNELDSKDIVEIRRWADVINNGLFEQSKRESRAGAKIVLWGEENGRVLPDDEPAFLERGRQLAKKHDVYLAMAYVVWHPGRPKPRDNKTVLIEPSGEVGWDYLKSHPIPGGEDRTLAGDGKLPLVDTRYGRLSTAICFDADFPRLIAQAGSRRADILLDPSGDWKQIDPLHTRMASFRAIEQGVNLVRHTTDGLSAAFDYQGHVLASMDHFQATDHTMIAQVPIRGARTIYSRIGDGFAWLLMAALVLLTGSACRRRSPL
jgi:apolipoprotein N-acyltransferase